MRTLTLLLLTWAIIPVACKEHPKTAQPEYEPDYLKGESLFLANSDSAFYYLTKVTSESKDSLSIAMSYNLMACIQSDAGDYFGAQESALSALKYLNTQKQSDQYCLMSTYVGLGTSMLNLKYYDDALRYFNLALQINIGESEKNTALNNIALVYKGKNEFAKAVSIYRAIEKQKLKQDDYARVISNLANASWLNDSGYQAAPELWQAMQIRTSLNDDWGLNASYSHLSDFYTGSNPDSALIYAKKMYAVAQKIKSPSDQVEALEKLIRLSPPASTKQYFFRYQFLNDSIHTARDSARNQFALVRYETEKSKADNLVLQKDNTEKRIQIFSQWIIISGTLLLAGFLFNRYRKRKQRSMKELKLKTSRKVHDIVANGLYGVITELQHKEQIDKDDLLDKIDSLYEQSRDISYEFADLNQDIYESASKMLASFATADTRVVTAGNNKELWNKLKPHARKELEHILKNLMINMKKHSQARNVVIRFEKQNNQLMIRYQDDGIGLPPQFKFGNGLSNTENRISALGGSFTFEKTETKGLRIRIIIPIN
ncbi:MAG: tetratricopeptide repeat-containing sensor histidine kinase [Pseudobacter sp.]|uniref:ATP-binding protein n=1 Tax=Pseudobacter sp. TaxID=2045420 RepID=UPI003F81F707